MTDAAELRRLAEAATPGPWMVSGGWVVSSRANIADCSWAWDRVADQPHMVADDLRYIAAMHPKTTLALLGRLAEAEAIVAQVRGGVSARGTLCATMLGWLNANERRSQLPDDAVVIATVFQDEPGSVAITAGMIREANR